MQHDTLTDALICLKNSERVGGKEVMVRPASKLTGRVLRIMQESGYLSQFEFVEDNRGGRFKVTLNGRINNCGIIRPRSSIKKNQIETYETRYLPAQNFGILILTTPHGVISNQKAKELGTGGKLLAYVF